jgi:hypothetical protein
MTVEERHVKKGMLHASMVGFIIAMMLVLCVPGNGFCGSSNDPEKTALLEAVRNFLDAEVRRDYPAIYACFAASSPYAQSHSYEQYLAEVQALPYRIIEYRIVSVSYIQDNEESVKFPAIEKIAQVEVELKFLHADTQDLSEINIGFVFFKERGRWYKS